MDDTPNSHADSDNWDRIFEVLRLPPKERIQMVRSGWEIQVGDFGWASPRAPKDKDGLIHLTGYDEKLMNIWYADLEASEVRFVGPKPTSFPDGRNSYPVKAKA